MNGCVARKSIDLQSPGQRLRLRSNLLGKGGGGHCEPLLLRSEGLESQAQACGLLLGRFSQLNGRLLTLKFDCYGGQMGQFSSSQ